MDEPHALIVGASSEIGRSVAVELATLGMSTTLWARDHNRMQNTALLCQQSGRTCVIDPVDVTDAQMVTQAIQRMGERGRLSTVVYAAGIFDWAPAHQADPTIWQQVLDVNLTAAATVTAQALPALIAAAPSSLIYIGSGAAHRSFANNAAYVASKHGLAGLADAVFLDVRDLDVKVSLISPGMVAAGASLNTPAGRHWPHELLAPADVAAAVRFIITFPVMGCPTVIQLQPQRTPD
jgi:NADP-dependent 3-hydroxy acid dehydrogenase YdfG